jgi:hypothetical protein
MKQKFYRIKNRIQQVNFNPQLEWNVINNEPNNTAWHLKQYVFPITLSITIATFVSYLLFAYNIYNYSFSYVCLKALASFCESFFSLYVSSLIVNELCVKIGVETNYEKLFKLMTYSFTAFWTFSFIAGILANYKTLGSFLKFMGIIGVYPFFIGSGKLMHVPENNKIKFVSVTLAIVLIVYLLINWSFGFALRAAHIAEMLTE